MDLGPSQVHPNQCASQIYVTQSFLNENWKKNLDHQDDI